MLSLTLKQPAGDFIPEPLKSPKIWLGVEPPDQILARRPPFGRERRDGAEPSALTLGAATATPAVGPTAIVCRLRLSLHAPGPNSRVQRIPRGKRFTHPPP